MTKAKTAGVCLILCTALCATTGLAATKSSVTKLYKWVDDAGVTHYGEVIPPEYADKNRIEIRKGREISEPKKKEAVDTGKKTTEEQAAIDQRRRDTALLGTYSNEKEIDLARDRNLQQVNARINSIKVMKQSAQDSLDDFVKEADRFTKAGKKVPASLRSDLADAKDRVANLQQELEQAQEKAASVRARFEADKARYRELTGTAPAAKK
jgi:chromosome segregation ATPase